MSALDVSIRAQILNLLKGLQGIGLAYIMVAHDLAALLSTRLAVMYAGNWWRRGRAIPCAHTRSSIHQALLSAALPFPPSGAAAAHHPARRGAQSATPPSGCRFHPRCPQAMPQCATDEPAWQGCRVIMLRRASIDLLVVIGRIGGDLHRGVGDRERVDTDSASLDNCGRRFSAATATLLR